MPFQKFIFYTFFCMLFFMQGFYSQAKTCTEVSFSHLNLSKTEAGFCSDCRSKSNLSSLNTQNWVPALSCFKDSINSKNFTQYTFCPKGNPKNLQKRRATPICKTDKYIESTAQVFREVTQCLGIEDPTYFYALINRESSFQITAESSTGASCYGQLTGVAIADINQNRLPVEVSNLEKCEGLTANWEALNTRGNSKTNQAICKASSNPYTCLAYSAVYYKHLLNQARNLVKSLSIPRLSFKNKNPKQFFLFKDENHLRNHMRKNNLQVKDREDISLFKNQEMVAKMLALQSYNGGPGTIKALFNAYVNQIKSNLWSKNIPARQVFKGRRPPQAPEGMSSSDFINTFRVFTRRYSDGKNRVENSDFVTAILKDYKSVVANDKDKALACGNIPYPKLLNPEARFQGL